MTTLQNIETHLETMVDDGLEVSNLKIPDKFKNQVTVAIGSIATVWTPASGKIIRLMGGSISVSAAVSILLEDHTHDGTNNYVLQLPKLLADTPYNFDLGDGIPLSAVDHLLKATSSAAANLTGYFYGKEE
jgi:hypothetical protein